ncbi:MAG: tRNA uridine-5-carboxymethylaminomethyl(34) synthesis GTPase MnmE [Paramuribaculum sp.]|nr:tRNA uridine-5-carboxymethylaminomethyl(34) synthesis GTPase MnmE [Paramuribaculum sp.]
MNSNNDTICAVSTPAGVGGIAVIRVSGPDAVGIVNSVWQGKDLTQCQSHTAHLGHILDVDGLPLDQCVVTVFRAPKSFTGDDVVEISVHGSRYVQRQLLVVLVSKGARLAEAGEFTRRAFTSGHMDLAEAEAVADVISSSSRAAHRIALNQMRGTYSQRLATLRERLVELTSLLELELDFSEEEVEFASRKQLVAIAGDIKTELQRLTKSFAAGSAIKDGIPVAIVGATNAGKSSLLNRIIGDERAIVSDIHGTTRDTIEETIELGDYTFRFIDTAGLRNTNDTIEQIGIDRSMAAARKAMIVIFVADSTEAIDVSLLRKILEVNPQAHTVIALNKIDLDGAGKASADECPNLPVVKISTLSFDGISPLISFLISYAEKNLDVDQNEILVTNMRHYQALTHALESINRVIDGLDSQLPGDLIAQDLRDTIYHISAITGTITTTEILSTIFSRFCIGK